MLKKRIAVLAVGFLLASGAAKSAAAQIFTPTYMAPRSGGDLGLYLNDGPGDFSLEGIWRRDLGGYDLGLRGGVASIADDAALLIGAEVRNPLSVTDVPLEFAFTAGAQAVVSSRSAAGVQVGLSAGHTFVPGDFSVTPYIHPRLALLSGFRDSDLRARVLADIGFDVAFQPNLTFRMAFGLGRETADWGIGLAWR
ncbi:MAG TPA: hypothetical protein VFX29_01815 [Longimicrobiaceae bacterium]|jgi:hypothetical protein|nr:hypothetical protein [Longimicrobiaceae bacterium]